ncbi:MAG: hypothetical protein JWQ27_1117 [Ferruginibacter sp.]|nr:hypothetical protein [Ferruginibacter sp.]
MKELKLVYSFAERSPNIGVMILPFVFFIIGLGIFFYSKKKADNKTPAKSSTYKRIYGMIFGVVFALFSGLIGAFVITSNLGAYRATRNIYKTKRFHIVQGKVDNYHPMPEGGHDTERFTVNGVAFKYGDYDVTDYGYNNAASKGGVIKEGLFVRICYFNNGDKNVILRLEIE